MDEVGHHRRAGLHVARGAVSLAMAACLLSSCTQETSDHQTRQGRAASGSVTAPGNVAGRSALPVPKSSSDEVAGRLPSVPGASNAPALARQLELAAATLRDRGAAASHVRRAGEFQQVAVGTSPPHPRRFARR